MHESFSPTSTWIFLFKWAKAENLTSYWDDHEAKHIMIVDWKDICGTTLAHKPDIMTSPNKKRCKVCGSSQDKTLPNLARGSSSSSWLTTSLLLTSRKWPAIISSLAQPLQSSFSKSTNVFTSARGMLYIPEISNVAAIHNKNNKCVCISWKEANSHPHTIKVGQMLSPRINCVDSPKDFVEELPLLPFLESTPKSL